MKTNEEWTEVLSKLERDEWPGVIAEIRADGISQGLRAKAGPPVEPEWCDQCPHAVALHNPDGTCGCGIDCARQRVLARTDGSW